MGFDGLINVIEDGTYWLLQAALTYTGHTDTWIVPVGFRTDFASVPHLLTWLVPRTGIFNRAAVLHDYLCRIADGTIESCHDPAHTAGHGCGLPVYISRKDTDGVFRRVLRELGVRPIRRWIMYCGVRIGAAADRVRACVARRPGAAVAAGR